MFGDMAILFFFFDSLFLLLGILHYSWPGTGAVQRLVGVLFMLVAFVLNVIFILCSFSVVKVGICIRLWGVSCTRAIC